MHLFEAENQENVACFNKNMVKTWWICKKVVTLHPLFVALSPKTALKKFKRKFEKTGVVKELRRRQQFDKPSVLKRLKMEHAVYVQQLRTNEE